MMILGVFLVSLLTFVCSQPPQVPYVQSIEAIEGVTYQLKERIMSMENEIPDITDPRRHYAVLVTHIGRVADILTESGPEYPKLFIEELPSSIVIGLMDVSKVIKNTKAILEEIESHTQKIQTLINTLCTGSLVPEVCNQVVHHAVIGDPERYKKEAELMLHAGHVAKQLLDADLVEVANEFDEQSYLIDFMHELNGLVLGISDLIVKVTQD